MAFGSLFFLTVFLPLVLMGHWALQIAGPVAMGEPFRVAVFGE